MAVNDFLKFAYAGGANKISQAVYAAAAWLGSGFPVSVGDKTAYSNDLNKVWSQASFMSNLIGAFINNQLGADCLDDGDSAGKLVLLQKALATLSNGIALTRASAATVDLGAAVAGVLSNNANITGVTTISSFGASASANAPVYFLKFASSLTLTNSGALACPGGVDLHVLAGSSVFAEYTGGGNWVVRLVFSPAVLTVTTSANDTTVSLFGKFILKVTTRAAVSNGDVVSWDTAFPTGCLGVLCSSTNGNNQCGTTAVTAGGFTFSTDAGAANYFFAAFGT